MRAAPLALMLLAAGCCPTTRPAACPGPALKVVTAPAKPEACPKPPAPDACVTEWYVRAEVPQCVDEWVDKLTLHREAKPAKKGGKP